MNSEDMGKGFVAVIDPAWGADAGGGGRGAQNHYALDDVSGMMQRYDEARDLEGRRIWPALNTKRPVLVFMWATAGAMAQKPNGNPPDAFTLARLLGVRVCASTVWAKVDVVRGVDRSWDKGGPDDDSFTPPARMGLGQWTRCEHESLLICRRGDIAVPPPEVRPRSMIYAPRGAHSVKPERAWTQVIEPLARACLPNTERVEFNCRNQRDGWAAYGALDGEDKPLRYAPRGSLVEVPNAG